MDVWTVIFTNLVANNLKSIDEVPANLRYKVKAALESNSEPV